MTDHEMQCEYDMLIGNLNRIMVTRDGKELYRMYEFAGRRLLRLYMERYREITDIHKREE